jgi:hypothetical protein
MPLKEKGQGAMEHLKHCRFFERVPHAVGLSRPRKCGMLVYVWDAQIKRRGGEKMAIAITTGGLSIALKLLAFLYGQLRPWLREQASKSETPLDEWMLDLLERAIEYKG